MIESLKLENVGPASSMELEFAPRTNLLTGDNGLGKSFLLDVAWWAMTTWWPQEVNRHMITGYTARPRDRKKRSTIKFRGRGRTESVGSLANYSGKIWSGLLGEPYAPWTNVIGHYDPPGPVIYAQADGSFSVWDPARNPRRRTIDTDIRERQPAYVFTEPEVWNGLRSHADDRAPPLCNGLLYDWSAWIQAKDDRNANLMASALRMLAPEQGQEGTIEPGSLMRLSVNDARDIPSINTSYAGPVPILYASSGIRRVCALAYVLVWAWSEHQIASRLLGRGKEAPQRIIMLFDEVESHLHPRWQRSILAALRDLGNELLDGTQLQLVVTTHSPLVLASAEAWFDPEHDAWFDLDLEGNPPQAHLHRRSYTPRGTAGAWLTSEAFDLATDRGSVEAERAILRARELLRQPEPPLDEVMQAHEALRAVLPDVDRFWVRWNAFVERRGGTP